MGYSENNNNRRARRLIADHAMYMSLPCSLLPAFLIVGLWIPVDVTVYLTAFAPVVFLTFVANIMRHRLGVPYWRYTLTLWPCTAVVIALFTYCTLMLTGGYQCMARIESQILAADIPETLRLLLLSLSSDPRLASLGVAAALVLFGWGFLSPLTSIPIHLFYNVKNRASENAASL